MKIESQKEKILTSKKIINNKLKITTLPWNSQKSKFFFIKYNSEISPFISILSFKFKNSLERFYHKNYFNYISIHLNLK